MSVVFLISVIKYWTKATQEGKDLPWCTFKKNTHREGIVTGVSPSVALSKRQRLSIFI